MLDTVDVSAYVFLNMGVCACGTVVLVIPLIRQFGVADRDGLLVGSTCGKNIEVEDMYNTIAGSSNVLLDIGVLSYCIERLSAPYVWELVTTDYDVFCVGDRLRQYGQHQSCSTITALFVAEGKGISVTCIVCFAIPRVCLAMANGGIFGGAHLGLVDGEVENKYAIATVGSSSSVFIST